MSILSDVSRTALCVSAIAGMMSTASVAAEPAMEVTARGCAAQFEKAQRLDMESFRDYDAKTFRAVHHPGGGSMTGM